jgi:hypothetical protein
MSRRWDFALHKQKRQPARVGVFVEVFLVARGGIEPPTQGFSGRSHLLVD